MNDRYFEKKEADEFSIKKIILKDGTELDTDSITHVAVVKSGKSNNKVFKSKITYCSHTKTDLIALSNECLMLSQVFAMMGNMGVTFEIACNEYDSYINLRRKQLKERGEIK